MPNQAIKDLINRAHSDPKLLNELLDAGQGRGQKLKSHGAGAFKRKEVRDEMVALLTSSGGGGSNGRLVEWVGAVATAAAGALAA